MSPGNCCPRTKGWPGNTKESKLLICLDSESCLEVTKIDITHLIHDTLTDDSIVVLYRQFSI